MTRRRTVLGALVTTGITALAGCSTSQDDSSGPNGGENQSAAAGVVETYYKAAANGNLESAAEQLAMTQFEGGNARTVEEMATALEERGLSTDGVDVSLGEFRELSLSDFREFTFQLNGETREFTDEEMNQVVPKASAFSGDDERVSLVHHTGGFLPELWVPYQPLEAPADGWGEVIIEVGPFDGDPYVIGDFRTFTEIKVVDN